MREGDMPDIVLMDIDLEGMSGIDGMKLIKSKYPEVEIIMLTVYHDSHKNFQLITIRSQRLPAQAYFTA